MLRSLLLASAFALAAPAMAQEVNDDMAPPTTEGMTAPEAHDQTAPNLPPGTVPTGTSEDTVDHSAMGHTTTTTTGSTSVTTDTTTETSTTGTTGTMTTATTGAGAGTDATADTTTTATEATPSADVTASTTTTDTFTGMGGPVDISQWASFDTVSDGRLSPLEFAGWIAESMGDMEGQAVELLNESADELALVDTDGDWHVSQAELTAASPQ